MVRPFYNVIAFSRRTRFAISFGAFKIGEAKKRLIEMMFLVLFLSCKCDIELTRVCVRGGVVTPTSGRANGLNTMDHLNCVKE
jgi:hypothetical protein